MHHCISTASKQWQMPLRSNVLCPCELSSTAKLHCWCRLHRTSHVAKGKPQSDWFTCTQMCDNTWLGVKKSTSRSISTQNFVDLPPRQAAASASWNLAGQKKATNTGALDVQALQSCMSTEACPHAICTLTCELRTAR